MNKSSFDKNIRCALITLAPFPIGNVSTLRYTSYLEEIAKKGFFTKVLILAPTQMAKMNSQKKDCFKGIHYQYLTKITWLNKPSFITKTFYYTIGLLLSVKHLKEDKINCLILYHQETFSYIFYWLITRIMRITYLTDKSEYPYGYSRMSKFRQYFEQLKLKLFDGFIVMTKELVSFYSKYKSSKAEVFHLPMTISQDRYKNVLKKEPLNPYISVVFGIHNRDGLYESIQAYNFYRNLSNESYCKLMIIGDFDKLPNKEFIQEYINNNNLNNDIIKTGLLPIEDVPQILYNSTCLLTTANNYISGGFPTKLGEYMLSNVPIVATAAGEISDYLTDGENIFLAPPGDIKKIALLLLEVQNNPIKAKSTAKNANQLAKKLFNATSYTDSLILFIQKQIRHNKISE